MPAQQQTAERLELITLNQGPYWAIQLPYCEPLHSTGAQYFDKIFLVNIPKLWLLPIRQVGISQFMRYFYRTLPCFFVSAVVLELEIDSARGRTINTGAEKSRYDNLQESNLEYDHERHRAIKGLEGSGIVWGFSGDENLWTDELANTIPDEHHHLALVSTKRYSYMVDGRNVHLLWPSL